MALVGSTTATAELIENSYINVLRILGKHLGGEHYLFGTRPSLADFALFGQLAQLSTDPWPLTILRKEAPLLEGWVIALDDASGVEGEWQPDAAEAAETRKALLARIGAEYLPFLGANAAALQAGQKEVRVSIDGYSYTQDAFAYQGKCYAEILRRWQALPAAARQQLEPSLAETGCLQWLSA
jgi:hypothetical protein